MESNGKGHKGQRRKDGILPGRRNRLQDRIPDQMDQNNKNNGRRLFTTYVVLRPTEDDVDHVEAEKYSLADAKSFVEEMT